MSYEHAHLDTDDDVPYDALDAVMDQVGHFTSDADPTGFLPVVTREVGDFSQAILTGDDEVLTYAAARVAAAGFAMVECGMRNGWALD